MSQTAESKPHKERHRSPGEGYIAEKPRRDGRWRAVLTLDGRRITVYGKTKTEARNKLNTLRAKVADGKPVLPERQTVGEYLEVWLTTGNTTLAPVTLVQYTTVVQRHIAPVLGRKRLSQLTPQDIRAFYADRVQVLAPSTVARVGAVLSKALGAAERDGLVYRNVAAGVRRPRSERKERPTFTAEQALAFLASMKGQRDEALMVLLLSTGMRIGEALALRWKDVDLDGARLVVRATLAREGGRLQVAERTKRASSRRPVSLTPAAVAALRAQKSSVAAVRLQVGPAWDDQDLVFPNTAGRPVDTSTVRLRFVKHLARQGMAPMRPHDLRHSVATLLLTQGVHPRIVMDLLGHASINVTMSTYSHVSETLQKQATDVLDRLLSG